MSELNSIGIIGTGKMGQAIIRGLYDAGFAGKMLAYDLQPDPELTAQIPHLQYADSVEALNQQTNYLLLSVKPQDLGTVCADINPEAHLISIAAGISTEEIRSLVGAATIDRISRVMPNIAALVAQSVSAIYCANSDLYAITAGIFGKIGRVFRAKQEVDLHAFTGLSGSGPAFVFAFAQALAEGGVRAGLPYQSALEASIQTLKGSIALLESESAHPHELRNRVTSPGGTTIAGLHELEEGSFHGVVMNAVVAASERSRELGGE